MSVSLNQTQGAQGWTINNLQPDAEGWVKVQLGRFGTKTISGDFVERLSDEVIAVLQDRATPPHSMFGEATPVSRRNWREPGTYLHVSLDGVSHQIKDIEVVIEEVDGVEMQLVYGKVCSKGPMGKFLDLLLATPDVCLRFGYRALVENIPDGKGKVRLIVNRIVTFDLHP